VTLLQAAGWLLVVVAILAAGFLAMKWLDRARTQRAALREVGSQFDGTRILAMSPNACFVGFNRPWDGQWQGEGVLLLTRRVLYFRPKQRSLDLTVALGNVESVQTGSIHAGDKSGRKNLELSYHGPDGQLRNATWAVRDPDKWARLVAQAMEGVKDVERGEKKSLP
jgi:hypothetical protein